MDAAELYARWSDRGPVVDGRRLTIMTRQPVLAVGEPAEIMHVYEVLDDGRQLFVMGPKPVYGEFVDGRRATPDPPDGEDPFAPGLYDGRVLPSPGVDGNFETTRYRFDAPGLHELTWRAGGLESNTLRLDVR